MQLAVRSNAGAVMEGDFASWVEARLGSRAEYTCMKLLLFDIDMTLVSTGGAGIRALNRAFERVLGLKDALENVRPHGKTDPAIIREACSNQGVDGGPRTQNQILAHYVQFLAEEVARSPNYRILPGVLDLLDACTGIPDVVLGLATGNVEEGARIKLDRGGLNAYFRFGGFGSDSEARADVVRAAARRCQELQQEMIAPAETWVIGDTPMDISAGKAAGFRTIAVATGTYSVKELQSAGSECVISNFVEGRDQFLGSTRIV